MGDIFTTFDLTIFFVALIAVMAVGLIAGRKEETSQDFFLAGRNVRWWGVAGSVFGTNVSANHIVGMMGVGFSIGFAQSHFEIGAIAGLMLLCYGFLPVYRKLNLYTLSEYLARRYDEKCRVMYALIMVTIMVVIQMVPGFYIGSRAINFLLLEQVEEQVVPADGAPQAVVRETQEIELTHYALGIIGMAVVCGVYTILGGLKAVIWTDVIQSVMMLAAGIIVAIVTFSQPGIGGWAGLVQLDAKADATAPEKQRIADEKTEIADELAKRAEENTTQSATIAAQDAASAADEARIAAARAPGKLHLYLPADHEKLPWTGVLTGLMVLHFFYWGTNQFIVQRTLGAVSDREARLGLIGAGYLKLLIPFFSVGTGIAAFYLFHEQERFRGDFHQDVVFMQLMKDVVRPLGYGIIGLVAAGLIGAILSSIDSMMNSAATIVTFDIYKRYVEPEADDRKLILVGRLLILAFVIFAASLAIFTTDPNSEENFFLKLVAMQSNLTPGLLAAFAVGMLWPRATANGAFACILTGIVAAFGLPQVYVRLATLTWFSPVVEMFGDSLNFFHSVAVAVVLSVIVHVIVSLLQSPDPEKSRLTWTDLGGHEPEALRRLAIKAAALLAFFAVIAAMMRFAGLPAGSAAVIAVAATMGTYVRHVLDQIGRKRAAGEMGDSQGTVGLMLKDDRFWAGTLCSAAVFLLFYYV